MICSRLWKRISLKGRNFFFQPITLYEYFVNSVQELIVLGHCYGTIWRFWRRERIAWRQRRTVHVLYDIFHFWFRNFLARSAYAFTKSNLQELRSIFARVIDLALSALKREPESGSDSSISDFQPPRRERSKIDNLDELIEEIEFCALAYQERK